MSEVTNGKNGEEAQSRFRVYERPVSFPGSCAVCGAVDRPVVDFGAELEIEGQGFGALLLCVFCVKQAASKFPDEAPVHVCTPQLEINTIRAELADAVADFVSAWKPNLTAMSVDPAGSSPAESNPADEGSKSRAGKSTRKADKSASVEGPASVSSDFGGEFGGLVALD